VDLEEVKDTSNSQLYFRDCSNVMTHYCLRQAARYDNVLKVEVTDPKDYLRDGKGEDHKVKLKMLNCRVDKRTVWGLFIQFCRSYILIQGGLCVHV